MEGEIYPFKPDVTIEDSTVEADLISAIVTGREAGKTKAEIIGDALGSKNAPNAFNAAWEKVESERVACGNVNPKNYGNETEYKAAIAAASPSGAIDPDEWLAGMMAKFEASSFADLIDKMNPEEPE